MKYSIAKLFRVFSYSCGSILSFSRLNVWVGVVENDRGEKEKNFVIYSAGEICLMIERQIICSVPFAAVASSVEKLEAIIIDKTIKRTWRVDGSTSCYKMIS